MIPALENNEGQIKFHIIDSSPFNPTTLIKHGDKMYFNLYF